jgi:hypothetical protein
MVVAGTPVDDADGRLLVAQAPPPRARKTAIVDMTFA